MTRSSDAGADRPDPLSTPRDRFAHSVRRYVSGPPARVLVLSRTNSSQLGELLGVVEARWPGAAITVVGSGRVLNDLSADLPVHAISISRQVGSIARLISSVPSLRDGGDLVIVAMPHLTELGWSTWLLARALGGDHPILYCDGAQIARDWSQAREELDLLSPRPHPVRASRAWIAARRTSAHEDRAGTGTPGAGPAPGPGGWAAPVADGPQARVAKRWLAIGEPFFRVLGRRPGGTLEPEAVRRVLVIEPDLLGDVVWATPLIEGAGRFFPHAEIDVLVGPWAAPLLAGDTRVTRVIRYSAPWFASIAPDHDGGPGGWWRRTRTRLDLFMRRYDVVLEPRGEVRHLRLAYLTGAPIRAGHAIRSIDGKHHPPTDWGCLLTHVALYGWDDRWTMHHSARNVEPLRALGYPGPVPDACLKVSADALDQVRALVGTVLDRDGPLVVLVPGASRPEKRWSPRGFAGVGRYLASRGVRVAVSGTESEAELAERVAAEAGTGVGSLAGRLDLAEYVALLALADAVVSNETAAIALCSAVGTPVVALMTGVPSLYGPKGVPSAVVQHKPDCYDPYIEHCACPWERYRCLDSIVTDEVTAAASGVLWTRVAPGVSGKAP